MVQPTKYAKKWIIACNIAISMIVVICIIIGVCEILAYMPPKNLKESTGTIAEFQQQDEEWYDFIIGGGHSTGNYFNITFEDGTYFQSTGISYENINRELFEKITVGEEIKITYDSSWNRPNRIYAIEYNGVNYLPIDDVLAGYEDTAKSMNIVGAITISLSIVIGGIGLFIANYKYRKRKVQNKKS